jgi:hypothetical protein
VGKAGEDLVVELHNGAKSRLLDRELEPGFGGALYKGGNMRWKRVGLRNNVLVAAFDRR